MSKIFYIMGKSCTGKDTIFKRLKENESLNLKTVLLYTTRPIRLKETQGKEYNFVTTEELNEFENKSKIIERRDYNTAHGVWSYFTADDGQINLIKDNYLMIGTLESYEKIKEYYGEDNVYPIYIEVDDETRIERALKREKKQPEPKFQEMCRRFLADSEDFSDKHIKDQNINKRYKNIELEKCLREIVKDIQSLI